MQYMLGYNYTDLIASIICMHEEICDGIAFVLSTLTICITHILEDKDNLYLQSSHANVSPEGICFTVFLQVQSAITYVKETMDEHKLGCRYLQVDYNYNASSVHRYICENYGTFSLH